MENSSKRPPPGYPTWLANMREQAAATGGKAWSARQLADLKREALRKAASHPAVSGRKPGELVNPLTGEVVTGCLRIGAFAKELGITTASLTKKLTEHGLVHMVNGWKESRDGGHVSYYLTPSVTPLAVEEGLLLSLTWRITDRQDRLMLLITPDGRQFVRNAMATLGDEPIRKAEERRHVVARLHAEGKTPAEIQCITGIPRRTVFRHLRRTRQGGGQ